MSETRAPSGLTVTEVVDWWINTFLPPGDTRSAHPYAVSDLRWIETEIARLHAENNGLAQANERLSLQNHSLVEQRDRLIQTRTPDEDVDQLFGAVAEIQQLSGAVVDQLQEELLAHQQGCDASDHNKRVRQTGQGSLWHCPYAAGTPLANIWQEGYRYRDMVNDG